MQEIICPHCNKAFTVDESGYAAIVQQIRTKEFDKDLHDKLELAQAKSSADYMRQINDLKLQLAQKESEKTIAIQNLQIESERAMAKAKEDLKAEISTKDNALQLAATKAALDMSNLKQKYETQLQLKEEEVERLKDFKLSLSTKAIGESLEVYCHNEFDKVRQMGFPNAYFEKDNDASSGTKGDFIFRDYTDADKDAELVSIMFEMKNEADATASKHRNEDFFDKLNKDRLEKNCEYAVLVSMLEPDSQLYNNGIVDVSHRYPKMYVIRPQFFIPVISFLRNAALNAASEKKELALAKAKNIDVTHFEERLNDFKTSFDYTYQQACKKFEDAVKQIDDTISKLQKVRESLVSSEDKLRIANNKAGDITIKKLTYNNPTMKQLFKDLEG